ncbi:hypothetical protein J53TS2_23220 [Paenibacillus sp. J53TS2]|uniref:WD40 repeat domain-containing protein n=1 Tax=Paenibacillus sp. J53TS2 TaxID=2807197 RepID=UPI001B1E2930|nr:WD40 repeat domain-containing protein [Paenibacillus sp. J53TS2]GIP48731.1 hypothetical protein J53TS2_23220 [Paenibacillus sp. J53TS2]
MKRKRLRTLVWLMICVMMLASCGGRPQTQTIIIPDTDESQNSGGQTGPFEVQKIYRIELATKGGLIGWSGADALLGYFSGPGGSQSLQEIKPPYDNLLQVLEVDPKQFVFDLSPDGQRITAIEENDGKYELKLLSLADGTEQKLSTFDPSQLTSKWFTWSDNSRYLSFASYTTQPESKGQSDIVVYDVQNGTQATYLVPIPEGSRAELYSSVHVADDGNSAFLLYQRMDETWIVVGTWKDGVFTAQYKHELIGDGQAAWMNDDQVAFLGRDGTLYTYDLRNEAVTVLLDSAFSFSLSGDHQYVAYSKGDGTLFAGKLQGNNVLNAKPIYQGILPSQMAWSPDNRRLLIFGGRSLLKGKPEPVEVQNPETSPQSAEWLPFIIEFK